MASYQFTPITNVNTLTRSGFSWAKSPPKYCLGFTQIKC
ncbi:hypothetical protein M23134_04397 [Microscilla marina ATCC 23134]|uniref:Uncharacterized protein n=1 Tax=Microscilla marina ATCC 23134 TaxID=313606 RepID=A1ZM18_MICM2|nr:hypothetical protein M23134_04397 [Microscilla marina ATCC 23134]